MNALDASIAVLRRLLASLALVGAFAASAPAQILAALPDLGLMQDKGIVDAIALQPDGKTLIGGGFDYVNGRPSFGFERLNADGTLDTSFVPQPDDAVGVIVVAGGTIYVAGAFTTIGGVSRNGLAAIDIATGAVKSWNPNPDGLVTALAVAGNTVYAAGFFTSIGGASRFSLAAIDATTGSATAWNPNPDDYAGAVTVSGSTVYVGGSFTTIGGQARSFVAALDATTGNATAWNPDVDNTVGIIAVAGGVVYMAGDIHFINGNPRNYVGAVDVATGALTAWNPNPNATVRSMIVANGVVYLGGEFTNAGGPLRNNLAAVDLTTGAATSWDPKLDAPDPGASVFVLALAASGTNVCAGGLFRSVAGSNVLSIARFDPGSAALVPGFRSSAGFYGGEIHALTRQPDGKLVAGGNFQFAGLVGVPLNNLLRLNNDYTLDTAWRPNVRGVYVGRVAAGASAIFIAGSFDQVGGLTRLGLAAVDIATGATTTWNPFPIAQGSDPAVALVVSGNTVYVGGAFNLIGNTPPSATRHNLAALDTTLGNATAWNPDLTGGVDAIAVSGLTVYAGGNFTKVGVLPRQYLAAIDATTGIATGWNPGADSVVFALAAVGGVVYAGGFFANIGGQPKPWLAALDAATGVPTSWGAHVDGAVEMIMVNAGTVYVAGPFTLAGGPAGPNQHRDNVAAFDMGNGNLTAWNPVVNDAATGPYGGGQVFAISISGSDITLGGRFEAAFGQSRPGLARLGPQVAAAQRTFVASDGSDANACTLAAPCATFATALVHTAAGGEIIALDSGAYGPVAIDKPITITATPGQYAGITVTAGTAIVVAVGSGVVTLRGLALNALGGVTGIDFVSGDALYVDRAIVTGFSGSGLIARSPTPASVHVRDSIFRGNGVGASVAPPIAATGALTAQILRSRFESNAVGLSFAGNSSIGLVDVSEMSGGTTGLSLAPSVAGATSRVEVRRATMASNPNAGIDVSPAGGATAAVTLIGVTTTNNGTGVAVHGGGSAFVGTSTITRNATGVAPTGGGTAISSGDNRLLNNSVDGVFTSTASKL